MTDQSKPSHDLLPTDAKSQWEQILPGLGRLWNFTTGDPNLRIAILDGAADLTTTEHRQATAVASDHGTRVTTIITGHPRGRVIGLCPRCTALNINIFPDGLSTCSQDLLAKSIQEAISLGANIINISAAQLESVDRIATSLAEAIEDAHERDVLVISATGNHGCACDTIPASLFGVLAVGAHDRAGRPLPSSNWGPGQRYEGIVAPGVDIPAACLGGAICNSTGTSFAAAIVSAISALLMSLQLQHGVRPSGLLIKKILLDSCNPCSFDSEMTCPPTLRGTLNVSRAVDVLLSTLVKHKKSEKSMTTSTMESSESNGNWATQPLEEGSIPTNDMLIQTPREDGLRPAGCGCGCTSNPVETTTSREVRPQLIYAIGRLGISFTTQTRRDSLWRTVNGGKVGDLKPISDDDLRNLFSRQPYQAQSVVWTLSRTEVPLYAIVPTGAFAAETYKFLVEQWSDSDVEFISVPGILGGKIQLHDGMLVDVLIPDLRGMYSWNQKDYTSALMECRRDAGGNNTQENLKKEIERFLGKIYFRIRNKGLLPEERALNAAATNAFNFSSVIIEAGRDGLTLKDVHAEKSALSKNGGDYYDVLLTFFNPRDRLGTAPLLSRITVDVSDTVPVVIGDPVIWYEY